jgi:hypothetical protein
VRTIFLGTVLVVVLVVGLTGCKSSAPGGGSDSLPLLTVDAASAAGLSAREVSDANTLYATKCAKCHKFYNPSDYSQKDWDLWMEKMSRKAKLNPEQEDLLTRYLATFRDKHQ